MMVYIVFYCDDGYPDNAPIFGVYKSEKTASDIAKTISGWVEGYEVNER